MGIYILLISQTKISIIYNKTPNFDKKKQKTINCCLKKTNDFSMHLQKEIEVSYIFLKTEIFTFGACLEKKSIYS